MLMLNVLIDLELNVALYRIILLIYVLIYTLWSCKLLISVGS